MNMMNVRIWSHPSFATCACGAARSSWRCGSIASLPPQASVGVPPRDNNHDLQDPVCAREPKAPNAGAANAATAPTLGGGVSVPGGKVIWLPLDSLVKPGSPSVPSEARIDATQRALDVVGAPASQPRTAGISVPTFSPKKFSKEVLYGPNGKPLYAFYARDAATAAKVSSGGAGERQLASRAPQASPALSQKDKEIERRVLFKLLREEEEQASSFKAREQQLEEEKSRAVRVASSSYAALVVSVMAVVLPLLTIP